MVKKQTKQAQGAKQVKSRNQSTTCSGNVFDACWNKVNWENFFRDYFRPRCK